MPLSSPAARTPIHTRTIEGHGFRRDDGLWDIEGRLVDTKSYPFDNQHRGTIEIGEPLHEMWLRLTVDDTLTIRAVEAETDNGPYAICGAITPNFRLLVGLKIRPGFTKAVSERVGGVSGCTHLVELVGRLATVAFQTVYPVLARERNQRPDQMRDPDRPKRPPPLLNTCHVFASDGEVARTQWPAFYTGDQPAREVAG